MEKPTVFISYSHKDEEWKDRLVPHLGVLQQEGCLKVWEDRQIDGGDDWLPEIEEAINCAHVAVLMISANFLTSKFILKKEVARLLERRSTDGLRVIPLIVKPCAWKKISWLSSIQGRPKDGRPLMKGDECQIEEDLAAFAIEIAKLLKPIPDTPDDGTPRFIPPEKIELSKLPTTEANLFGREKELTILDEAWENPRTNIISFIAMGGAGKSALMNAWLNDMAESNYKGAARVYGWSFYSQGTKEDRQASSDNFINDALDWFDHEGEMPSSQFDRGRRLAELIGKTRTLLILDGLEPLQYPPGEMYGRLKDQAIEALLKALSRSNSGLCLITSRCPVTDIRGTEGRSTYTHELDQLTNAAGRQLLQSYDIAGKDEELEKASAEFKGHALALHLMGSYIKNFLDGDIHKRFEIPALTDDENQGGHAKRVMASYEKWFQEKNRPELDILNLLGLFDRPAAAEAIEKLKQAPPIVGLTERLDRLSERDWKAALNHLRELRLLSKPDETDDGSLDCHPLIREYFGEKLEQENKDAWQAGHGRLYDYYKELPEKELPDTLEEMEPLFAAVKHGALAGRVQEAMDDVYWERVKRGHEHYCTQKLGAFGTDLACLSAFFASTWDRPADGLSDEVKPFILSWAGFRLRAVGRLREAAQPMKAGLEMAVSNEDWKPAAIRAGNLSELQLTLGDLQQAAQHAEKTVAFADRSGNDFQMESKRTVLANALLQLGQLDEAEKHFIEAEKRQLKRQPDSPYLYSLAGYLYCNLLITQGCYETVMERAKTTIKWVRNLLSIALDSLSIGRALMLSTLQNSSDVPLPTQRENLSSAQQHLDLAVDGLREAGHQQYLPLGLLARAALYRHTQQFTQAWTDLDEAWEIAEYGEMRLHQTDYYLEAARNIKSQLSVRETDEAHSPYTIIEEGAEVELSKAEMEKRYRLFISKAEQLINETSYHRRDDELAELKQGL